MSVHGNPGRWLAGLLLALTASLVSEWLTSKFPGIHFLAQKSMPLLN